jgi:hypothetical protein
MEMSGAGPLTLDEDLGWYYSAPLAAGALGGAVGQIVVTEDYFADDDKTAVHDAVATFLTTETAHYATPAPTHSRTTSTLFVWSESRAGTYSFQRLPVLSQSGTTCHSVANSMSTAMPTTVRCMSRSNAHARGNPSTAYNSSFAVDARSARSGPSTDI